MLHNGTRGEKDRDCLSDCLSELRGLYSPSSRLARVIARFSCLKNARQFVWDLDCLLEIVSNSTFKAFIKQAREKSQKKIYADILHRE